MNKWKNENKKKDEEKRRRLQEEIEEEERVKREIEILNARENGEKVEKKNKQQKFKEMLDEETGRKNVMDKPQVQFENSNSGKPPMQYRGDQPK